MGACKNLWTSIAHSKHRRWSCPANKSLKATKILMYVVRRWKCAIAADTCQIYYESVFITLTLLANRN